MRAGLLAVLLFAGCSGEVAGGAPKERERPAGLQAEAQPQAPLPAPALKRAPTPSDPRRERRAAALTERFRERISHWTGEARRLSKGRATGSNVEIAACVREVGSRTDLVALRADESQPPASNMKLVTTAAALILLGRDARWITPCEASAPVRDGLLSGDLVVRASGDPLVDPSGEGRVEARVEELARALRATGLTRVQGDLVLDEGSFEAPGPGPSWPDPSQRWAEYCALSGGFSVNGGVLHAHLRAGAVGSAAEIAVHPRPSGLKEDYGVRTLAGNAVDVRVGATTGAAVVRGTLGAALGEYEAEFAHPDPVAQFGALLGSALRASGIELAGGVRRERGVPRGVVLAELSSPLADCLESINAESKNGVADQVFLSLGHALTGQGTRAGGAQAIRTALERLGVRPQALHQVDGSGLSRDDRASAHAITALLEGVLSAEPETARLYRDSLAVMGRKGTLEERLRGTQAEGRVFAKTGWIGGVSALSGYAERPDGRAFVFSFLVQYPSSLGGLNTSCFKPLQDELVLLLFQDDA